MSMQDYACNGYLLKLTKEMLVRIGYIDSYSKIDIDELGDNMECGDLNLIQYFENKFDVSPGIHHFSEGDSCPDEYSEGDWALTFVKEDKYPRVYPKETWCDLENQVGHNINELNWTVWG